MHASVLETKNCSGCLEHGGHERHRRDSWESRDWRQKVTGNSAEEAKGHVGFRSCVAWKKQILMSFESGAEIKDVSG